MAGAFGGVKVEGLRELQRACALSEKEIKLGVRAKLREAAEPVRVAADELASSEIRNLGPAWGRMRVGVTTKAVYVAPKSRRHGGTARRNLADLLMNRAMEPALTANVGQVEQRLEEAIDDIANRNW